VEALYGSFLNLVGSMVLWDSSVPSIRRRSLARGAGTWAASGAVIMRRVIRREQLIVLAETLPPRVVGMEPCFGPKTLEKFGSTRAQVHNDSNQERHLITRRVYKQRRSAALTERHASGWASYVALLPKDRLLL
jgi:hypothetical protein